MPENAVILLVEDEATDAYFVQWAFRTAELPHRICHVQDGQEALDYLTGKGIFADRVKHPLPSLMLLDLKMPRLDGFAVLAWLRERPEWAAVPVVVLSSSQFPGDVQQALDLGAADYNVKPGNPQQLLDFVRKLEARWLQRPVKEPREPRKKSAARVRARR